MELGEGLTRISESAFEDCENLKSIVIPQSVTKIEQHAFSRSGLTAITIPKSVGTIELDAFYDCKNLKSVEISNGVHTIENYAFKNCSGLTSITLPSSLSTIGYQAFDGVDLSTVISLIVNPMPLEGKSNYFSVNTFNNATLYVPAGSLNKYKVCAGWERFMFIEEGTGK